MACDKTLRDNDLLVAMTVLHVLQTILAPIGMISIFRFGYQLFRRSKVTQDTAQAKSHSSSFLVRLTSLPKGNRLVAHSNMQILYVNHLVAAVLLSFFSLLVHITFWGSLIISPQCDIKYSALFCLILNTPVHVCTHAVALSLFFLCIERIFSTLFYRSYASVGSTAPKAMVIIQYLLCSLIFYYQIFTIDTQSSLSICSLIGSSNQWRTTHVQVTVFTLELTSLVAFGLLKNYNTKQLRQTIGMSLKERYQLDENVRTLRTIFPTIIMHTICFFIPNLISLLIFIILAPRKPVVVIVDVSTVKFGAEAKKVPALGTFLLLNWLPYYGVLLPIVINRLSKKANRVQVNKMITNAATGDAMQNNYFKELNVVWK